MPSILELNLIAPLFVLVSVVALAAASKTTGPVKVWLPLVVIAPPLILMVAAFTIRELKGVLLPIAPLKVVIPLALILKAWVLAAVPLMVAPAVLNKISPALALKTVAALKSTGPVKLWLPLVVMVPAKLVLTGPLLGPFTVIPPV